MSARQYGRYGYRRIAALQTTAPSSLLKLLETGSQHSVHRPLTSHRDRPCRQRFACLSGDASKNGYVESFNARLRDELLNGEIFHPLKEAQIIVEAWCRHHNTKRPHSAHGYKPPAPKSLIHLHERTTMNEHSNRTCQTGLVVQLTIPLGDLNSFTKYREARQGAIASTYEARDIEGRLRVEVERL